MWPSPNDRNKNQAVCPTVLQCVQTSNERKSDDVHNRSLSTAPLKTKAVSYTLVCLCVSYATMHLVGKQWLCHSQVFQRRCPREGLYIQSGQLIRIQLPDAQGVMTSTSNDNIDIFIQTSVRPTHRARTPRKQKHVKASATARAYVNV